MTIHQLLGALLGNPIEIPAHEHTSHDKTSTGVNCGSANILSMTTQEHSWMYIGLMVPILGIFLAMRYAKHQKNWDDEHVKANLGYLPSTNCKNPLCRMSSRLTSSIKTVGILGGCGILLPIFLLLLPILLISVLFQLIMLPFRLCCFALLQS
ncbi:hypothetical protein X556_0750 [Chlamydia pneumoniae B21]|nr:hypothetical protein X556_0750 [Chlamydia pneumoniae B21]